MSNDKNQNAAAANDTNNDANWPRETNKDANWPGSARLINSTTTLVAKASETDERVRRKSKTDRWGGGREGGRKELSQTRLNVLVSTAVWSGWMECWQCKMEGRE